MDRAALIAALAVTAFAPAAFAGTRTSSGTTFNLASGTRAPRARVKSASGTRLSTFSPTVSFSPVAFNPWLANPFFNPAVGAQIMRNWMSMMTMYSPLGYGRVGMLGY